jgi:hypothetical protein
MLANCGQNISYTSQLRKRRLGGAKPMSALAFAALALLPTVGPETRFRAASVYGRYGIVERVIIILPSSCSERSFCRSACSVSGPAAGPILISLIACSGSLGNGLST